MSPDEVRTLLAEQGVQADCAPVAAAALLVTALLETTAERFGGLPLEAEPAGFQVAQRREAP
jgi:hypothetical protein